MKRHQSLVMLSWDHHHGLVLSLRIAREAPEASESELSALYSDVIGFWSRGLVPHFHVETDCLLARLVNHIPRSDPRVERLHSDHLTVANLVIQMRDTTDTNERRELLLEFGETLRTHIRWEEASLFSAVQDNLTEDELSRLGAEITEAIPEVQAAPRSSPD